MSFLPHSIALAFTALLLVTACGCRTRTILKADFNQPAYRAGHTASGELPGAPAGDAVEFVLATPRLSPAELPADRNDLWLTWQTYRDHTNATVRFKTATVAGGITRDHGKIVASWTGRLDGVRDTGLQATLLDNGRLIVAVRFADGQVTLLSRTSGGSVEESVAGEFLLGENYVVFLSLDFQSPDSSARTAHAYVSQRGVAVTATLENEIPEDWLPLRDLDLRFDFTDRDGGRPVPHASVDNVVVVRGDTIATRPGR